MRAINGGSSDDGGENKPKDGCQCCNQFGCSTCVEKLSGHTYSCTQGTLTKCILY